MTDYIKMDTTTLAFLGDAVYEEYVRKYVVEHGTQKADRLHAKAVRFVNAGAQAKIMKTLFDGLPPEDQALVKRARNKKTNTKAKNASPVDYKWATAFEALIGYYKLSGQIDVMEEFIIRALNVIDGKKV
jgi:ribonuclease-3 family protein